MNTNLTDVRDRLVDRQLCDHCLGRQFGMLGHGLENYERGAIAREREELTEQDFDPDLVPDSAQPGGDCMLCEGMFNEIDEIVDRMLKRTEPYEFHTFIVGSRIPEDWLQRERELQEEIGVEHAEPIKREVNRWIGKQFSLTYPEDIEDDHEAPDLELIVDLPEDNIERTISPLYVFGRYNKYSREIPQTVWHCRSCRGSGCFECNGTGKTYQESVQELIEEPFVNKAGAKDTAFHGAGREDIDVRCLGKRDFVLELSRPRRRRIDLDACREEVHQAQENVEVFDLSFAESKTVEEVKEQRAEKTYRATVELERTLEDDEFNRLSELEGEIEQETPSRVSHRRAEKIRKRTVRELDAEQTGPRELELTIRTEAGTYIKELITGDEGRTHPNLSECLGMKTTCRTLDVIEFHSTIDR